MIKGPGISICERGIVFTERAGFEIATHARPSPDVSLVVDLYSLDNPVHPDGHVGWWKFNFGALPARAVAEMRRATSGLIDVELDGAAASARWVNADMQPVSRLVVHAVLRSNATNALLCEDRIPAMASETELEALRQSLDRVWSRPRFSPAPYLLGTGQTIHLVAPNIQQRDAVGNLCLDLYRMLRQNELPVRLYAENTDLPLTDIVEQQMLLGGRVGSADHIMYFCSTADARLAEIAALPGRKSVYFHGITDPTKLRVFDPELAVDAARGRGSLKLLERFDVLAANSHHSAAQLAASLGRQPGVIAIIPPEILAAPAGPAVGPERRSADLLAVGQLSSHKKFEDVLRLFAAYRRLEPAARCHIVGRPRTRAYRDYLEWVESSELALPAGAVVWHGSVTDERLTELYRAAAALMSMSEDEGFCLPLFEAMGYGTPVFAFGIPAVRETLGGAGIAFAVKQYDHLARQVHQITTDATRREAIVERQAQRYMELAGRMSGRAFFELLAPV